MDLQLKYILQSCRNIELSAQKIYQYYAKCFASTREIKLLWMKAAREEREHADVLDFAIRCREESFIHQQNNANRFAEADLFMKKFREDILAKKTSLKRALHTTVELEPRLVKFRLDSVVDFSCPHQKKVYSSLIRGDGAHVKGFQDAYSRLLQA